MTQRAKRAERILSLRQQLKRIEDWRLAELQRRLADLDALQQDLVHALNEEHAVPDLFVAATARRLRRLSTEADEVDRERKQQALRVAERAGEVRRAEHLVETVRREDQRKADQQGLVDAVEQAVAGRAASLR